MVKKNCQALAHYSRDWPWNQSQSDRDSLTQSRYNGCMTEPAYPHLFTPLQLGGLQLGNRVLMGSMHTGLEEMRGGYKKLAAFYGERARGGVELIVTGGISPDFRGRLALPTSQLSWRWQLGKHRYLTEAVHDAGSHICLQILHAGRYAMHPFSVAPSAIRAPISRFTPRALSDAGVHRSIQHFVNTAQLAQQAGYDGVEIMGSEGYLINQFISAHTNQRNDAWGGSFERRMRFAVEIVRRTREAVGSDFLLMFRLSMLDLLQDGSSLEEVVQLAQAVEQAGADVINTGIGWHEVRIPTIAASVPRAAFTWVTAKLKPHVSIPLITSNRINMPDVAEHILAQGEADMVSMARPFLADAEWVNKARAAQTESINTCIACNQGCLDHVFQARRASCLVNPRAGYETELLYEKTTAPKTIVVVGLGPAGLSAASVAASRGHRVIAFEAGGIGGQFNLASKIPGKEEFVETLRYYRQQLKHYDVDVRANTTASVDDIVRLQPDAVVLATGVTPRTPDIEGIDHPCVMSYVEAIHGDKSVGENVLIIGAGGIGFDVATLLVEQSLPQHDWYSLWGVDRQYQYRGGVTTPLPLKLSRRITMLQRKTGKPGAHLGKTTGWIHRLTLRRAGVQFVSGVRYLKIDDAGLHVMHEGETKVLAADSIITCAGQLSNRALLDALQQAGCEVHVIGGASRAAEIDAERAIREGAELGASL